MDVVVAVVVVAVFVVVADVVEHETQADLGPKGTQRMAIRHMTEDAVGLADRRQAGWNDPDDSTWPHDTSAPYTAVGRDWREIHAENTRH